MKKFGVWFSTEQHGFSMVFETDRVTFYNTGIYVEKYYVINGLFKMNVMTIIPIMNKKKFLLFLCLSLPFCSMVN